MAGQRHDRVLGGVGLGHVLGLDDAARIDRAAGLPRLPELFGEVRHGSAAYLMPSNSTSKISVAFGGMSPPAPRAP